MSEFQLGGIIKLISPIDATSTLHIYRALNQIHAMSFDLDDTLYANAPVIAAAEAAMLTCLQRHQPHLTHNDSQYWQLQRKLVAAHTPDRCHDVTTWRLIAVEQGLQAQGIAHCEAAELAELAVDAFLQVRTNVTIASNIRHLLEQLATQWPLVAITNGNADVTRMGLGHCFVLSLRAGPSGRMKPYPDMFIRAANSLGIPSSNMLHVGDHVRSDVLGALNAGCMAAWLNPPSNAQRQPLVLPHLEISSLHQLAALIA